MSETAAGIVQAKPVPRMSICVIRGPRLCARLAVTRACKGAPKRVPFGWLHSIERQIQCRAVPFARTQAQTLVRESIVRSGQGSYCSRGRTLFAVTRLVSNVNRRVRDGTEPSQAAGQRFRYSSPLPAPSGPVSARMWAGAGVAPKAASLDVENRIPKLFLMSRIKC